MAAKYQLITELYRRTGVAVAKNPPAGARHFSPFPTAVSYACFMGTAMTILPSAAIWMKPMRRLMVQDTMFGSLHGGWNETKSAMPLPNGVALTTGGLIFLWNRLFYRAVVRSEYRAYQPHHGKERRRFPLLSQQQRHFPIPFVEMRRSVRYLCRRGAERA